MERMVVMMPSVTQYHSLVGVVGNDMDASLLRLSSCDWGYGFFLV